MSFLKNGIYMKKEKQDIYQGFEQGPIRPPSESNSLLLRFTRNCPWNRCTFCSVYNNKKFSLRSIDNILKDIELLNIYIDKIKQAFKDKKSIDQKEINKIYLSLENQNRQAFNAALQWYLSGMESIFLQDANSLIIKPCDLIFLLEHIKKCFPDVKRITSYARSHTIVRIKQNDLEQIAKAGLNRIHIGMESGSDIVLKNVNKGVDQKAHIEAGIKVKKARIQLSEYVMPGLGGVKHSKEHAIQTALALNKINPDHIRLRTLAITRGTILCEQEENNEFEKPTDEIIAKEIKLFLQHLDNITSYIKSDHILNLFETIDGKMPEDKENMIGVIDDFLKLEPKNKVLYQVGRRMGFFKEPADLRNSLFLDKVKKTCELYQITPYNVDSFINGLMKNFV